MSAEYAELTAGQIERIVAAVQWPISGRLPPQPFHPNGRMSCRCSSRLPMYRAAGMAVPCTRGGVRNVCGPTGLALEAGTS